MGFSWSFSAGGGPMTVDWGDGSAPTSHATTLQHTYGATEGNKTVSMTCPDWSKLLTLDLSVYYGAFTARVSQPMMDLSKCVNLTTLSFGTSFFNSYPAALSLNTKLTTFSNPFGAVTSIDPLAFSTQKSLATISVGLYSAATSTPVDNLLAGLVSSLSVSGRVACTVTTGGLYNNAGIYPLPSDAGAANAATLIAAGWTVPNIAHPWFAILGDSISQSNPSWVTDVAAAWNGGSGVGVNAIRDFAIASQGILVGANKLSTQVARCSNAQLILVFTGVNDDNAGNMTTLRTEFETQIGLLKTQNPGASIYNIGVLPRWTNNTTGPEVDESNIRTAISLGCTNQSIPYWDTYTSPIILQSDTVDGLHLAASGLTKLTNYVKGQLGI
jgi:hypothetical protein